MTLITSPYIPLEDLFRFIEPSEISVYCGFETTIYEKTILPSIQIAQDLKLKKNLGDVLYNKLKDEFLLANKNPNNIRDSSQSPDGIDYKGLYFKCFPVLVWWSAVYSLSDVAIKIEQKGIMFDSADYAENGALETFKFKEARLKTTAEEYTEELVCYLEETFPKNSEANSLVKYQEESVEEGTRSCGIFFPKKFSSCKKCK
jgi:hypothetical protein